MYLARPISVSVRLYEWNSLNGTRIYAKKRKSVECAVAWLLNVMRHVRPHQQENESGLVKRSDFLAGEVNWHTEERTVGLLVNHRAGEEKNVGVECSAGQRATAHHLVSSESQGSFLCVVKPRTDGGVYGQFVSSLPCALLG